MRAIVRACVRSCVQLGAVQRAMKIRLQYLSRVEQVKLIEVDVNQDRTVRLVVIRAHLVDPHVHRHAHRHAHRRVYWHARGDMFKYVA